MNLIWKQSSRTNTNTPDYSQGQANGGQNIPESGTMTAKEIFWFNNNLNVNNNNQVTLDINLRNLGRKKWKR